MLGRLVYKTDDLGTTYIEWDKIASVSASGEFEVELESGEVLFGKIGPGPAAAEMTITLEPGDVVHPLAEIVRITSIKRTFWGRVDGKLDLGASFNHASEIAQFTLHTEALIKRPNFWTGYDLDSIFTQQKQAEDTALHRFALNYYYVFASRWLSISRIIFEQNRELGFDLRASVNLGAGRFVVQTNRTVLMLGLGVQVNRERPNEGDSTTNLAGLIVLRYWSFFFDYPNTDVDARLAVLPDLSSSGSAAHRGGPHAAASCSRTSISASRRSTASTARRRPSTPRRTISAPRFPWVGSSEAWVSPAEVPRRASRSPAPIDRKANRRRHLSGKLRYCGWCFGARKQHGAVQSRHGSAVARGKCCLPRSRGCVPESVSLVPEARLLSHHLRGGEAGAGFHPAPRRPRRISARRSGP